MEAITAAVVTVNALLQLSPELKHCTDCYMQAVTVGASRSTDPAEI